MPESFDVVVVGARCAGAPLAMLLARSGLRVCMVDRSRFPSEVPSTHAIQPSGVAALERFGVLDRVRATGAPAIIQARFEIDGVVLDYTAGSGFVDGSGTPMWCVRRRTLDPLMVEAAAAAGVDVREATAATGVLLEDGRVVGIETANGPLRAALVVGADGPHSTVARSVGAREYHVTPPGRLFLWGYFEGASDPPPRIWLAKVEDAGMLAAPTDGGLFLVVVAPSLQEKERYLADTAGGLLRGLQRFQEVPEIVAGAKLAGPVRTMARWHGYFREAAGPGWVLVGDAGHFKDPTPGQGIADAFRQVEQLAPVITEGLADGRLDERLQEWARWRDADAWEMYWFAHDMGAPGPTPPLMREMIRQVVDRPGGRDRFLQVMDHQVPPSELFTPGRALAAAFSLATAGRPGSGRLGPGRAAAQLGGVFRHELARRRLGRNPVYQAPSRPGPGEPARVEAVTEV